MGISIGYETKNGLEIRKKYGQNVQNTKQNQTNSIKKQTSASVASLGNSPASDSFTSGITGNVGSGNTCTDGKDDGHIGLFSKVANVAQGVVRSGANIIKAAVKHPVKALAMTAVGFVPVVGPAVLGGLAVYGAVQGAKEVVGAVKLANAADNDADAKAAWEHIGSGVFTTALSVTGAKASAKAVHNQLTGGSSTVNTFREKGFKKETFQEAFKETKANAGNFIDGVKAKLEKAKGKIDDFKANKELGNGKEYVKEEVQKYADKKRYGEKAGDVQKAREELKAAKEKLNKAQEELNNARKPDSGKTKADIKDLENDVITAQEQVNGVSKETYKKAETKFKEATKDIKDKTSKEYKDAKKAFEDEVHSAKRDYDLAKKNNTVKKQKIAQKEAEAKAETDANKTNFENNVKNDLEQKGYEIKLDENGNGVATKGENEVKIENYKKVGEKEVTATTKKSTTGTKTGAKLESEAELDANNKVVDKSKTYTGDIGKGEDNIVSYKQRSAKVGDRVYNYETYNVGGKEYTYVNGKPIDTASELSFSQRQLLKYNAKHSASKATTVDASVLYAQQAAAVLNANRY